MLVVEVAVDDAACDACKYIARWRDSLAAFGIAAFPS